MSSDTLRRMRCPLCGRETLTGGIGAVHCGPHETGSPPPNRLSPAVAMVEVAGPALIHVEAGTPAQVVAAWGRLAREEGRPS